MTHAKVTMAVERDSGGGKEDHVSGSDRSNSWRGTPGERRGSRACVREGEGVCGEDVCVTEEMAEERGVRALTWQLDGLEVRVLGLGGGARAVRDADVLALVD